MPESLLKRIIAVSSNPGDCVLDPFSGSGTTAAAARQLNRNYVCLDVSEKYVKNARKRLAQLKKETKRNVSLSSAETTELKRLVSDMAIPIKEITSDKNLSNLLTNQFSVRMNNKKKYSTEKVIEALKELAD